MNKRIIAALCAAFALCLSLAACSSGGASSSAGGSGTSAAASNAVSARDAFVGTWDMIALSTKGETYDKSALEQLRANGGDSYMVLDESGEGFIVYAGKRNTDLFWSVPNETTVKIQLENGTTQELAFDGTQLKVTTTSGEMAFEKGEPRATIPEKATGSSASSASADASSASVASSTSEKKSAKYEASIDDITVGEDYKGNPALIVTYTWKNNSDKNHSFAAALHPRCYVMSGIDSEGYMADVRPGYGTTLQMAYELKDTENPVDVEVYELASFKGDPIAAKTYKF